MLTYITAAVSILTSSRSSRAACVLHSSPAVRNGSWSAPHLKNSMKNPFGGDIKGSSSPSSRCDPVNGLLPMPVLLQLGHTAIVVQTVPVLTNHKVGLSGQHILTDKLTTIAAYKVKPASKRTWSGLGFACGVTLMKRMPCAA